MRKEFKYNVPELVLLVSSEKKSSLLEPVLQKALDVTGKDYVVLSLSVRKKDLPNMLRAIKLMEVKGLFIESDHRRYSKSFTDGCSDKLPIDTVSLRKNRYAGMNCIAASYEKLLKTFKIKEASVSVYGEKECAKTVKGILMRLGAKTVYIIDDKKLIRGPINKFDFYVICGPSEINFPKSLAKHLRLGAKILDLREGPGDIPKDIKISKKDLVTNDLFLSTLATTITRFWTNKKIDSSSLKSAVKSLRVK